MTPRFCLYLVLTLTGFSLGCGEESGNSVNGGADGGGIDRGIDSGTNPGTDPGSATLTIDEETWMFNSFSCAFGHDATMSAEYSFSSTAFGEHSTGARVQMQAEIIDKQGEGRFVGEGVHYEIYINDIDNFENPVVDFVSRTDVNQALVDSGLAAPSGMTLVTIDGNDVVGAGNFDDETTELEFENLSGTLVARCGDQSRR